MLNVVQIQEGVGSGHSRQQTVPHLEGACSHLQHSMEAHHKPVTLVHICLFATPHSYLQNFNTSS